ncbi:uncharacterized protein LOC131691678 isoform X2 [Topomyia yanbarensis]|uniref:uncharacterized protein LOC131691678 isoform X2 n=1 Tax=Topomyia yanbarensis TaxID=2498891 RepID=UPI00273A7F23|nr:uncharacterized protein LOC131691678 isoform X2 [Topomyia yanbarensis]
MSCLLNIIICGLLVTLLCATSSRASHRTQKRQTTNTSISPEILQQYPNGAFDDRKPDPDPNNQQFKDYVNVLTRFDDWVTGQTHTRTPQEVLPDDEINDPIPQVDPNNQRFKDYVSVLTRFDDWATGHGHVRGPQDVLPDDEFNDPKPSTDSNNTAFKEYVTELTRFDPWITGQKVPIPTDPATDALHQDIGNIDQLNQTTQYSNSDEQSYNDFAKTLPLAISIPTSTAQPNREEVPFSDNKPTIPPNSAYNDYVKVLTRFDPTITGQKVPIPADPTTDALHQVFRRSLISPEEHFADQISDSTPVNPAAKKAYNDFVSELKRFDPWITGHKVPIPRDAATDALHEITKRSLFGSRN